MGLGPESSQRETVKGNRTWIVIEAVDRSVPGAIAKKIAYFDQQGDDPKSRQGTQNS